MEPTAAAAPHGAPDLRSEQVAYVFLVIMGLALLFALPLWPHSRQWGWTPTALVGVMLGTTLLFGFAGGIWSF